MIPVLATELECYLFGSTGRELTGFWCSFEDACRAEAIPLLKIEQERGNEQYEFALEPMRDVKRLIEATERAKLLLHALALEQGMHASFEPKPLPDDYGSGLHVHLHLEDSHGHHLFWKQEDAMSAPLAHAIAGLLDRMRDDLPIFVPTEAGRARFIPGQNVPLTVSWGANNRTCALRLPDKAWDQKHIEHRVSGADAPVGPVIEAIIAAVFHGLEQRLMPPPQIYGDASLAQYDLPPLFATKQR